MVTQHVNIEKFMRREQKSVGVKSFLGFASFSTFMHSHKCAHTHFDKLRCRIIACRFLKTNNRKIHIGKCSHITRRRKNDIITSKIVCAHLISPPRTPSFHMSQ